MKVFIKSAKEFTYWYRDLVGQFLDVSAEADRSRHPYYKVIASEHNSLVLSVSRYRIIDSLIILPEDVDECHTNEDHLGLLPKWEDV